MVTFINLCVPSFSVFRTPGIAFHEPLSMAVRLSGVEVSSTVQLYEELRDASNRIYVMRHHLKFSGFVQALGLNLMQGCEAETSQGCGTKENWF